jgi:hypothetical protein
MTKLPGRFISAVPVYGNTTKNKKRAEADHEETAGDRSPRWGAWRTCGLQYR